MSLINFNDTNKDDDDNGDDYFIDDINEMLGDIQAASHVGVQEEPATHRGSRTFVELETTTFDSRQWKCLN